MHSKLARYRRALTKPRIYKEGKKWVCKNRDTVARAAKPVTAYRAWARNIVWIKSGRPGDRSTTGAARAPVERLVSLQYQQGTTNMATLMCSGKVMLVKTRHGIEATTYDDEVEAVEDMLNNGSLGGGSYHGCEQHVAALARVAGRIEEIRAQIEADVERQLASDFEG